MSGGGDLGITVAICSAGRDEILLDGLAALAAHEGWGPGDEVVVVLNGPGHLATRRRIDAERSPGGRLASLDRLRVDAIDALGVTRARNRATELARGEVILSLDDDARPCEGWLAAWRRAFAADPGLAAAGGPIELGWPDGAPPPWFHPRLVNYWSGLELTRPPAEVAARGRGYGANLAMRRAALQAVGGFDERLGRGGTLGVTGEESELLDRLDGAGHTVGWVPDARVVHLVDPARVSLGWLLRRAYEQGRTDRVLTGQGADWWRALTSGWSALARATRSSSGSGWRGELAADLARRGRLLGRARGPAVTPRSS